MRKKVIIIGGVAGGASAAARLRRMDEQAEIVLVERGAEVSFANCGLPYHIGGVIADERALRVQTAEGLKARFAIDVRTRTEARGIDREKKLVHLVNLVTGEAYDYAFDQLILSPGAKAFVPPIPGIDLPGVHTLRTMDDMRAIRAAVDAGDVRHAVVVGGGFIGLEVAENLRGRDITVTLVEAAAQILPPFDAEVAGIAQKALRHGGVAVRLNAKLTGITSANGGLSLSLEGAQAIQAELVVLAIGVRAENELAQQAGLALAPGGGVAVDTTQRTDDPEIWAVGDAAQTHRADTAEPTMLALAGPANRQGRVAADGVAGQPRAFGGVVGTAIVKLFDWTAAMTGRSEKALCKADKPYEKIYVHPNDHAGYYPGAVQMTLKLLFAPDGKVLGAQAVGQAGVDKRIDVIATVIKLGGTVHDLAELELCYAPPYGSAKDPVNVAGMVAENVLSGRGPVLHWHDWRTFDGTLLDVRTAPENARGALPGSLHIPLDELRQRLGEIPSDTPLLVYCAQGLRGYLAQRILMQRGFDRVYNLSGGMRLFEQIEG